MATATVNNPLAGAIPFDGDAPRRGIAREDCAAIARLRKVDHGRARE
jgi:hypothetical protein